MVNWVIIAIICLFVFLFFKVTSFRYERWWTYFIAVIMIFLLFSFFSVVRNNDLKINTVEGFMMGAKFYLLWLVNFGKDATKITGQVTSINWNVTQNASFGGKR